uniref:Uncharacterized protein n=1 Tax=Arion vulgaris TaxID=1028688 RepID=A0A0B7B3T2_9EUPU
MVIIALDNKGNHGAANIGVHSCQDVTGTLYTGFCYVTMSENMKEVKLNFVPPLTED